MSFKEISSAFGITVEKWYKLLWVRECASFSFLSIVPNTEPVTETLLNKSMSKWVNEWTELQNLRYGSTCKLGHHPWSLLSETEINLQLQGVMRITQMVKSIPQCLEESKAQYILVNFLFSSRWRFHAW